MPELTPLLSVARDILTAVQKKQMHVNDIAAEAVKPNRNMTMPAKLEVAS